MDINVNEILNQLAKGFNVAVEELYPILYKQAIIDGIISSVYFLINIGLLLLILYLIKFITKKQKEDNFDYDWDWDEPRQVVFILLSLVVGTVSLFAIPYCLETAISAFFNTEYYMIENILSKLK